MKPKVYFSKTITPEKVLEMYFPLESVYLEEYLILRQTAWGQNSH